MRIAEIGTDLDRAEALLREGHLIGLPTETVYGLAGNALNPLTVASIFATKARPSFDPLIIHLPGLFALERYVKEITPAALKLAESCWPGPLTMIFPRRAIVPDLVTAGLDTVAVRVPAHPMSQALLHRLDFPLAAPSANPFGYVSPTTAGHVSDQLGHKIPYILDGGPCQIGVESSIVSFVGPRPQLLRKGGLTLEEIESIVGQELIVNTHGSSNPVAPGMLAKHYSPKATFLLKEDLDPAERERIAGLPSAKVARLVFQAAPATVDEYTFDLSPRGSLAEAASKLFATMRSLDDRGFEYILADLLPETGLGRAINDRLRRAAAR